MGRGMRTIQRWEREAGLPVHRVGKGPRSPVHAFPHELNAWLLQVDRRQNGDQAGNGAALDHLPRRHRFREPWAGTNSDSIRFSTFDSNCSQAPDHCSFCNREPASLLYEVCGDDGGSWGFNGYCCAACGVNMVKALEARHFAAQLVGD